MTGNMVALFVPNGMDISDGDVFHKGAVQDWYCTGWQRKAGCGPTTGANLLRYLARFHAGCAPLFPYAGNDRESFVLFMEDVWRYITPTIYGVNKTGILSEGAVRYAAERGVRLRAQALDIPPRPLKRAARAEVRDFLVHALQNDLPIAFLNLSNGACEGLDSWHWVTIVALETKTLEACILDDGKEKYVNIGQWLRTSACGGGFVALAPHAE